MKVGIPSTRAAAWRALLPAVALAAMSVLLIPEAATPQEPGGRFRVLVVPMESDVLDDDFGEDVADELRDRLEDFETHAPVEDREYRRALKQYEVDEDELNKIKARQLANLLGAQLVFWGSVTKSGAAYEVSGAFIDVTTGDEVLVPPITIRDDDDETVRQVADAAIGAFERQVRFVRARQFCADYVGSQQPENALRNCNEALAINSNSVNALFNKALAFRQLFETARDNEQQPQPLGTNGWADSALVYFERVLENDPGKREALENAAYVYSQIGEAEKAGDLYRQYLELDPANVPVRLKVAYDLAQVDLMEEAIQIIQAGLEYVEEDVDLLQSLGDYSLRYSSEDSTYIDTAVDAYQRVLEIKGGETELGLIENTIAAYTRANRVDEAVGFAERALTSHSDSPRLWSLYADALGRTGRYADAATAMDSVIALNPSYANAHLKRGQFKLQAGDEAAALADFNLAIEEGSSTQEDVFNLFWGQAHGARNEGRLADAIDFFEYAAQFAPAANRQEVEFWWGYTYYQLGEDQAEPEDANMNQLQRAQANFQAAIQHFDRAGSVRQEVPQLKDAAEKWLLNVDARIRRLSRGR